MFPIAFISVTQKSHVLGAMTSLVHPQICLEAPASIAGKGEMLLQNGSSAALASPYKAVSSDSP